MKPHEETWDVGDDGAVRKVDAEGTLVGWTREQTRLIAAAPDMARALLACAGYFRDVGQALPCWCGLGTRTHRPHDTHCDAALTALRKAGVIE